MPATDISTIHVKAAFVARSGKAEKTMKLSLQFFNAANGEWTTFSTVLNAERGQLKKTMKPSPRSAPAVSLKRMCAAGGIPPFRLVQQSSLDKPVALVVAKAPAMTYHADTKVLALDFGNNFAQPPVTVKTYLQDEAGAASTLYTPVPAGDQLPEIQLQLEAEKQQLAAQLAAAAEKMLSVQSQLEAAKADAAVLKKEIADRGKVMTSLETEMEKVRSLAASTESRLATAASNIAERDQRLQTAAAAMAAQSTEMQQLQQQVQALNSTISRNVTAIQQLNDQLRARDAELAIRDNTIAEQANTVKLLEEKIRQFSTTGEEYRPAAQPVSAVYASILDEFAKTNELNKNSAYRVSNISLNLKTFVEHDANGIRMQLVDANKLVGLPAEALSDFKVEIGEPAGGGSTSIKLPDVTGLTETAARRILVSLGLGLKPVYQNKRDVPDGQAFRQSPVPGDITPGQTVSVVFSKHNS